jgi:hypothetical protein
MDIAVEVGEQLTTANHVEGGTAIEVPAVELVLAEASVEEGTGSWLLDVEVGGGLGAEC